MFTQQTPGLYRQPVMPVRAVGRLSRGDVPVFLGYTRRGPVGLPVRIEDLTSFHEIFGAPRDGGHLGRSIKGFFETGGRTAYVIRVARSLPALDAGPVDPGPPGGDAAVARVAHKDLPGGIWRVEASFPWTLVDPRERRREARPDEATWVQLVEDIFRTSGPRSPAPGSWANGYTVAIRGTERVRTQTIPTLIDDPFALPVMSLAGLEAQSVLTLSQTRSVSGQVDEVTIQASLVPVGIDPVRRWVKLAGRADGIEGFAPPTASNPNPTATSFDLTAPIQIVSVEFDIEIYADGRLEQSFRALSPNPAHSASIATVLTRTCRSLNVAPSDDRLDWAEPANWPPQGVFALTGGTDGLEGIRSRDYLDLAAQIARLDEVALIAPPDLVLQSQQVPPVDEPPREAIDCCDMSPSEHGKLMARVVTVGPDGTDIPLRHVSVDVTGPGGRTETDDDGYFSVTEVSLGVVTVRLTKEGFESAEALVQSATYLPSRGDAVTLAMARVSLPRALTEDEVLEVVQGFANPALVGPYKVVFADPPRPDATLDDLRTWRSRLGDSNRIGFFAPWLRLPPPETGGDLVSCPPSGHVCGAFAAGELSLGVHRTGANLPLHYVQAVSLPISEVEQGILNPAGINAIRTFPGRGVRAFGTRTLSSDPEWTYLTARRVVDAIEKTLERALHWMVFEPNSLMTRHAVAQSAVTLLESCWRSGILAGASPAEAFVVKCDLENNPDETREAGTLVVDIGVAPTTPFEFVLFRLGNALDALAVTESTR